MAAAGATTSDMNPVKTLNRTCRIDFQPTGRRISLHEGANLFEAAREDGVGLTLLCAGKGTCGKCKVRIVSGAVSPLQEREREALGDDEIAHGYRLACLTLVHGDLRVEIPVESLATAQRVELSGRGKAVLVDPAVQTVIVDLSRPSQADNRSDHARAVEYLAEHFGMLDVRIDLCAQRRLSAILRESEWRAKLSLHGDEVVMAGRVEGRVLGLAIDLGTTSIAAYLSDLETGEALEARGMMNPQISYGEDVISRISYAIDHDAEPLRESVLGGINTLIGELCSAQGLVADDIAEVVLVGNTAMHHLLLGLPVRQLLHAPYVAAVTAPLYTKCRDVGIMASAGACIYTMPNIGSFVGADHVAMLLASGFHDADVTALGIDIGTNTEITLAANGRLSCCSCASGPAFEGAHISNGMRAVAGAIEKVTMEGDAVTLHTISGGRPVGLCGSGVLDAIAQLHDEGIIDDMGKLKSHPRVRDTGAGKEFVLVRQDESATGKDITLTGNDISEIQLAKGAIASGISILLENAQISWRDIDHVIIAGAFGTYIDVASAISLGMLPPLPVERFSQVGNAAGVGARLALLSKTQRQYAIDIARRVEHIELTSYTGYPQVFANALRFCPARNWRDDG